MILLLDNFDSFTYNLVDYFGQLNTDCRVIRNDVELEEITNQEYQGLVISPGPEVPERAGNLMQVLNYYSQKIPVLGICLGHQAIAQYCGGRVFKAPKPMHGKISVTRLMDDPIFTNMPDTISVVRYNSLIVDQENSHYKVIAVSQESEVMALKHKVLPMWGLQFHPEAALTECGLDILKNWLTYNKIAV